MFQVHFRIDSLEFRGPGLRYSYTIDSFIQFVYANREHTVNNSAMRFVCD